MDVLRNFSLRELTTIKIGGKASFYVEPTNEYEVLKALEIGLKNNYFILGKGANTIFGDFDGIVISTKKLNSFSYRLENKRLMIYSKSGSSLKDLIKLSAKFKAKDFYKLSGFPASVGGAIAMNAGAFGVETSNFLLSVKFVDKDLAIKTLNKEEIEFSYRTSLFSKNNLFILEAIFSLEIDENLDVYSLIRTINEKRITNQPLNILTSGSTFKNPEGTYAGKLLEECGFKGKCVNDICFSSKHANFLENKGNATFNDVIMLIGEAKQVVYEKTGILLKEEVKLVDNSCYNGW